MLKFSNDINYIETFYWFSWNKARGCVAFYAFVSIREATRHLCKLTSYDRLIRPLSKKNRHHYVAWRPLVVCWCRHLLLLSVQSKSASNCLDWSQRQAAPKDTKWVTSKVSTCLKCDRCQLVAKWYCIGIKTESCLDWTTWRNCNGVSPLHNSDIYMKCQ